MALPSSWASRRSQRAGKCPLERDQAWSHTCSLDKGRRRLGASRKVGEEWGKSRQQTLPSFRFCFNFFFRGNSLRASAQSLWITRWTFTNWTPLCSCYWDREAEHDQHPRVSACGPFLSSVGTFILRPTGNEQFPFLLSWTVCDEHSSTSLLLKVYIYIWIYTHRHTHVFLLDIELGVEFVGDEVCLCSDWVAKPVSRVAVRT